MEKEKRCCNKLCPMSPNKCMNYSEDAETYELVEKQFDLQGELDEQPFFCETFEPTEIYR